MTSEEIARRCRPIREARKPVECKLSDPLYRGVCWVRDAHRAMSNPGTTYRCNGCKGVVDPKHRGWPKPEELAAVGIDR